MVSKTDKIGRDNIVSKISFIAETLPENDHYCIALDGEWGSGKSFVIEKLEEKFDASENYFVVKYDAWKNNFYNDPLIAILYCIFDELRKQTDIKDVSLKKQLKKITNGISKQDAKRIVNLVESHIKKHGNIVDIELLNKIKNIGQASGIILFVATVIKNIIKQLNTTILDNSRFNDFKSYQSLLNEAKAVLSVITSKNEEEIYNKKLIILVDEIDRCLPDEQMKVLERIHHLFDLPNCLVVVALNKKILEKSFSSLYFNNSSENEEKIYLKKFFQYEIKVHKANVIYLEAVLSDLINEYNNFGSNIIVSEKSSKLLIGVLKQFLNSKTEKNGSIDIRDLEKYKSLLIELSKRYSISKYESTGIYLLVILLFLKMFDKEKYNTITIVLSENSFDLDYFLLSNIINIDKLKYIGCHTVGSPVYSTSTHSGAVYTLYNFEELNGLQYLINIRIFSQQNKRIIHLKSITKGNNIISNEEYIYKLLFDRIVSELENYGD